MTTSDWIVILAIVAAPVVAVHVQKTLEVIRERKSRRLKLFHTLMATRAARVSAQHVQALNMIDFEFYNNERIRELWKIYLDHFGTQYEESEISLWISRGDDFFIDLLHEMATSLGYSFDRVHLKKGIYTPIAHGDLEMEQLAIRKNLTKILSGEKALPMEVTSLPYDEDALSSQKELQSKLISFLDGNSTVRVKTEE